MIIKISNNIVPITLIIPVKKTILFNKLKSIYGSKGNRSSYV